MSKATYPKRLTWLEITVCVDAKGICLISFLDGRFRCAINCIGGVIGSAGEELHVTGDDLDDATITTFIILEGAVLESAFDIERITLFDVTTDGLAKFLPADHGVELGLFLITHGPISGDAERSDGFASCGGAKFGRAGGVADKNDLVDTAHKLT